MFTSKEFFFVSIEEVIAILENLQQENQTFCESIVHFQNNQHNNIFLSFTIYLYNYILIKKDVCD
jgi:hypothetical protein